MTRVNPIEPTRQRRLPVEGIAAAVSPVSPVSPWIALPERFYVKLEQILEGWRFDHLVDGLCARLYGRQPSCARGAALHASTYFRLLMVGLFEGLNSAEDIARRMTDSVVLRRFVGGGRAAPVPEVARVVQTRQLINATIHEEVFHWLITALNDCAVAYDGESSSSGTPVEICPPWARAHRYPEFLRRFLCIGAPHAGAADGRGNGAGDDKASSSADPRGHRAADRVVR